RATGFFFFNDTATTEIYTLSLHDALPISGDPRPERRSGAGRRLWREPARRRSEEHTSELQSLTNLVCRLLLEKRSELRSEEHTSELQSLTHLVCRPLLEKEHD